MKAPDVAMEGGGRRGRSAADRRPAASALLEFRDTIGPWPPPAYVVVRFRRVDRRSTTRVWQPMPLLPRSRPEEPRSEEHTSELQSLMRISYAVFCLKKKKKKEI